MATITVNSLTDILIDGASAGQALDVCRNHPAMASDVQRAIEAWVKTLADKVAAAQAERDAAVAIANAQNDAVLAANKERDAILAKYDPQIKADKERAEKDAAEAELAAKLAEVQALKKRLGKEDAQPTLPVYP